MWDDKGTLNNQIDSTNIFEDFTSDASLWADVKKQEKKKSRDIFYYLKVGWNFLKVLNLIVFLLLISFYVYSFFQNRVSSENYSFLEPVCQFILWDVSSDVSWCYSVSGFLNKINSDRDSIKTSQFKRIEPLFQHVYTLDNFKNSKSMTFLLDRSENRLRTLDVISEFDSIKNSFESVDKSKVVCYDMVIQDDMSLTARCDAYSSDWDSDITNADWVKRSGTSVSIASSFIDFIDNSPDSKFSVSNKQKIFQYTNVSGNGIYTRKTNFDLNLRYIDSNSLSL